MNNSNKNNVNNEERICQLYGICGKAQQALQSNEVTEFGLHCLSKDEEDQ